MSGILKLVFFMDLPIQKKSHFTFFFKTSIHLKKFDFGQKGQIYKMTLNEFGYFVCKIFQNFKFKYTVEKNENFLTSFSLSNKSTYFANKISYRKISEINVKAAKIKFVRLSFPVLWKPPNDICIVKEFWWKSRFCWEIRNGSRKVLDCLRLWRSFRFFFGVWNLAFLRNVWAFHFYSMWNPKIHFYGGNADNFPLCSFEKIGVHHHNITSTLISKTAFTQRPIP
jgi:hypothetical protein